MPFAPVRIQWPLQLTTGEESSFTVEPLALANTNVIYDPVLRFHNMGNETMNLKITYTLDLGSGPDPLYSGTFTLVVVDNPIVGGDYQDYTFGGIPLVEDTILAVTHVVTVKNNGANTHVAQTVLFGQAEIDAQLRAGQEIVRGT